MKDFKLHLTAVTLLLFSACLDISAATMLRSDAVNCRKLMERCCNKEGCPGFFEKSSSTNGFTTGADLATGMLLVIGAPLVEHSALRLVIVSKMQS